LKEFPSIRGLKLGWGGFKLSLRCYILERGEIELKEIAIFIAHMRAAAIK